MTMHNSFDVSAPSAADVAASSEVLARRPDVTLVEGTSFCVCDRGGALTGGVHGLFVQDTRVLSRWEVTVDGGPIEPLGVIADQPFSARFIGRCEPRPGHDDATLLCEQRRFVGQGWREDLTLRNYAAEAAGVDVHVTVDADFADLFEVKEASGTSRRVVGRRAVGHDLLLWLEHAAQSRGVRITAPGAQVSSDGLLFRVVVPAHGTWSATIEAVPSVAGEELAAVFPTDSPVEVSAPARRMHGWTTAAPVVEVGHEGLREALAISRRDLGALRIADPDHPDDDVVAAGAPWFMALFGRDSLLTSSLMLPFFPELALGTLRTLARLQGRHVDPLTEEEPGRILHEVRLGADLSLALGGSSVYYGSIDSTPLFVALVGQAVRWGAPADAVRELMPAVDRAMAWLEHHGDRDGDGFIEYQRSTDRGLLNQGWKDSSDSISFADGPLAQPPIALAEVQGYAYAAHQARADLAELFDDPTTATRCRERAAALKERFHERFWLPDAERYALALDAHKEPVDAAASNVGHCLWSGIVAEAVADKVAALLVSPAMFTGFGVRTLSADAARYNPVSYHNGSVWPHDSVLAASGLARYGFRAEAEQIVTGLLDAAESFGGRLPELFCGFARDEVPTPVSYPASCSPQAWAAAVPYELVRLGLGLEVDVLRRRCAVRRPMTVLGGVRVSGLRVREQAVQVVGDARRVSVLGLPPGLDLVVDGRRAARSGSRRSRPQEGASG